MSPVGRRESLEARHEAQKLQALLQELLAWAQGLRAEMDARGTPGSPAGVLRMLEDHQAYKVRSRRAWAFPKLTSSLPPLPLSPTCSGSFASCPPLSSSISHPRAVFPTSPAH